MRIFHTVNAALYLYAEGTGILIDGIHQGKQVGLSDTPVAIKKDLQRRGGLFSHIDALLFTHFHPDHCDMKELQVLQNDSQSPLCYGPGMAKPPVQVGAAFPGGQAFQIKKACIAALDTTHDGEPFKNEPHISFAIQLGQQTIFIAGDAVLSPTQPDLYSFLQCRTLDAAFLNCCQLASKSGQQFLRTYKPRRLFLYHLPFPEDDKYHYRELSRYMLRRYPDDLPRPELLLPMRWLDGDAPKWAEESSKKSSPE